MRPPPAIAVALALLAGIAGACREPRDRPVRVVLSLHGAAGRPIHGVDLTVALPAGARVAHDPATGRIAPAALAPSAGPAATVDAHFSPHGTTPSIRALVASREPLPDGPLVAIDVVVRSAAPPPRERFEVVRAAVAGSNGATIPGATGWVSAVEPR